MSVYMGFIPRLIGYVIDAVITVIFFQIFLFLFNLLITALVSIDQLNTATLVGVVYASYFLGVAEIAAYFVYFWSSTGQAVGGRIMGFQVISEATGGLLSPSRALLRYIGYVISGFILCLGFLWALWDPKKQGWHDKVAGSVVIPVGTANSAAPNRR